MEIVENIGSILGVLISFITIISAVCVFLKKSFVKALKENTKPLENKIDEVKTDFEQHTITECRRRIINFYNDIRNGIEKTEESWNGIHEDCDAYETYCDEHENFHNGKAMISIDAIRKAYADPNVKKL